MKKNKKSASHLSALQLALIITGSIVAAAGIITAIIMICKKKAAKKKAEALEDDSIDLWDIDEDILSELELDEEECCCGEDCDCTDCAIEDAVEEAVEALEQVSEEAEKAE